VGKRNFETRRGAWPAVLAALGLCAVAAISAPGAMAGEAERPRGNAADRPGCRSDIRVSLPRHYQNRERVAGPMKARNCGGRPKACVRLMWGHRTPPWGFGFTPSKKKCIRLGSSSTVGFLAATAPCQPGLWGTEGWLYNSRGKVVVHKKTSKLFDTICNE